MFRFLVGAANPRLGLRQGRGTKSWLSIAHLEGINKCKGLQARMNRLESSPFRDRASIAPSPSPHRRGKAKPGKIEGQRLILHPHPLNKFDLHRVSRLAQWKWRWALT
jgi:hypothetical protein